MLTLYEYSRAFGLGLDNALKVRLRVYVYSDTLFTLSNKL